MPTSSWTVGPLSGHITPRSEPAAPIYNITINYPQATPVTPTFDPKIDANALYGKPTALAAIGSKPVRIGGSPAPLVGPYINAGLVDFLVSIALIVPVDGIRKLFKVYLDQELAWSSATGWDGSGAQPGDAIYHAETFDLAFRPGTLSQSVLSLETDKFPGDENAYRPQVLIQIRGLRYQRYMDQSGRPVPYVSAEIGDFSNGRGPDEQINLGEALELIAHSPFAGYTSDTFEAENITDAVDGIILKDNFNIVQLCQSIARVYRNINVLQSDKLRIKDHGSNVSPDIVLTRDNIIGADEPISIVRTEASAQPRELELLRVDPDQDYTIVPSTSKRPRDPVAVSSAVGKETITTPVIMDAQTGQAMVTFAHYYEENARKKISGRAMAYAYEIEPADLIGIVPEVDGIDSEIFKVTQTDHGPNLVVEFQAEAILRCSLFSVVSGDPYLAYVVLLLNVEGADGSTTITDESPALHGNATIIGNTEIDTAEKPFGTSSVLQDGTGDGISYADNDNWDLSNANGDQFTIEIFARLTTATPTSRALFWQGGAAGTLAFFFWIDAAGQLEFSGFNDGTSGFGVTSSGLTWATGTFYHLAVSKDAYGKVRVFRNGVMVASSTPANSALFNSNQTLRVGIDGSGGRSWPGWWKGARITKGICRYPLDGGFTVPTDLWPTE